MLFAPLACRRLLAILITIPTVLLIIFLVLLELGFFGDDTDMRKPSITLRRRFFLVQFAYDVCCFRPRQTSSVALLWAFKSPGLLRPSFGCFLDIPRFINPARIVTRAQLPLPP